jgi:hypothetical protein
MCPQSLPIIELLEKIARQQSKRRDEKSLFFFRKTEIFFQLCNGGTALPPIIDTKYGVILSLKGEDNVKMGQIAFLDRFSFC